MLKKAIVACGLICGLLLTGSACQAAPKDAPAGQDAATLREMDRLQKELAQLRQQVAKSEAPEAGKTAKAPKGPATGKGNGPGKGYGAAGNMPPGLARHLRDHTGPFKNGGMAPGLGRLMNERAGPFNPNRPREADDDKDQNAGSRMKGKPQPGPGGKAQDRD